MKLSGKTLCGTRYWELCLIYVFYIYDINKMIQERYIFCFSIEIMGDANSGVSGGETTMDETNSKLSNGGSGVGWREGENMLWLLT